MLLPYEVWKFWVKGYSSYWAETDFNLRVTVTLTFDLLTPKSLGFFNLIRAITLWSLKALALMVPELLSGNGFHSFGHCDLDLWPTEANIKSGFLLNKGYHPMKFEDSGSKGTWVIEQNGFHSSGHCDLDLWPTDPEINRGLLLNKGYHPMKFEGSGSKGTRVIERKRSVTDGQTDKAKTMSPPEGGRHNLEAWLNLT